jgi:hypothetical protein
MYMDRALNEAGRVRNIFDGVCGRGSHTCPFCCETGVWTFSLRRFVRHSGCEPVGSCVSYACSGKCVVGARDRAPVRGGEAGRGARY